MPDKITRIRAPNSDIALWAYSRYKFERVGNWHKGNGWDAAVHVECVQDIVKKMQNLARDVIKLGLFVHGESGAIVGFQKDGVISHRNIAEKRKDFQQLGRYLTARSKSPAATSRLILFACNAGDGPNGDKFLATISQHLPYRLIVGFERQGVVFGPGVTTGDVYMKNDGDGEYPPAANYASKPTANEQHVMAKWAFNGVIIRPSIMDLRTIQKPLSKYMTNKRGFCGSVNCQGHSQHFSTTYPKSQSGICTQYVRFPRFLAELERLKSRRRGQAVPDVEEVHKSVYGSWFHRPKAAGAK